MTNQSPITPPPELLQHWQKEPGVSAPFSTLPPCVMVTIPNTKLQDITTRAAQWGADQELEACLGEVSFLNSQALADRVRAARRPKPLSLKEQSIALLDLIQGNQKAWQLEDLDLIRRALEALPND
jgi:hypothetical protein